MIHEHAEEHAALKARLLRKGFQGEPKVLTLVEIEWEKEQRGHINIISYRNKDEKVLFIVNDLLMGMHVFNTDWMACSSVFPTKVVPRPAFPDGKLRSAKDVINLYYPDSRVIEDLDEVVAFAIATKSYRTVEETEQRRKEIAERCGLEYKALA